MRSSWATPAHPTTSRQRRCPRRWPTCRSGRRSASLVHARAGARRPCGARLPGRAARSHHRAAGVVARRPGSRGDGRRAGASVCTSPMGPLADGRTLLDLRLPDRLRELDFELPLAGRRRSAAYPSRRRTPRRPGALLRRHLPAGDPVLSYADHPRRRRRPGRPAAARLPHRVDRRGAAGGRPVPVRRLQDQLARRPGRAADLGPTTAGRAGRGDGHTPTTRSRHCSTPSCCTGSCAGGCPTTTRRPTSVACSTSTSAACAGRTPRVSTGRRAASSPGGRRSRWSRSCPHCSRDHCQERGVSELFETGRRARPRPGPDRARGPGRFNAAGVIDRRRRAHRHHAGTARWREPTRTSCSPSP